MVARVAVTALAAVAPAAVMATAAVAWAAVMALAAVMAPALALEAKSEEVLEVATYPWEEATAAV